MDGTFAVLTFALGLWIARAAPGRERAVVALLLAVAAGGLWHPLSLRVLSLTGESPRTVEYIVDTPGRFVPVDSDYPVIDLGNLRVAEYWQSLRRGQSYRFELQRVAGDRWVLRLGPFFERTRAFYSSR